jgi:hypothetical protein
MDLEELFDAVMNYADAEDYTDSEVALACADDSEIEALSELSDLGEYTEWLEREG